MRHADTYKINILEMLVGCRAKSCLFVFIAEFNY